MFAESNYSERQAMNTAQLEKVAAEVAEVTFKLLANCQEKEERLARQFRISVPEFRTLRMFRGDDHLQIKELIRRVGLSGSRLTRILDSLESNGFVIRSIDLDDRRSIIITLSDKGRRLTGELEQRYVDIHKEILEGIPGEMHETVLVSLSKMLSSLEKWLRQS